MEILEAEKLISEIRDISSQYQVEVGSRRRPWPKSIKDRVFALGRMGIKGRTIAADTGIPYFTILQWRHKAKKRLGPRAFQELTVVDRDEATAVTVPTLSTSTSKVVTVTVTTPRGYRIEGDPEYILPLLKSLQGRF